VVYANPWRSLVEWGLSLKKIIGLTLLLLLAVSSSYTLLVFASTSVGQTQPSCPTYQVNLIVDVVNSNPINAAVGDTVVTTIHVVYQDGTPVTLSPETVSFSWNGTNGQKIFDNVQVVYTGKPGFYNYTQTITQDLVQTTGEGKVTIAVVSCSCSDGGGNRGPISLTDSDLTLTPSDNSNLSIGPSGPTTPTTPVVTYIVAAIIILLLIIALLLFLRRGRKKQK
jgi:hypothetical protein